MRVRQRSQVCILDGWGENVNQDQYNAVHVADTPTTDHLKTVASRWRTVQAHGTAVGLPSDAGEPQSPYDCLPWTDLGM